MAELPCSDVTTPYFFGELTGEFDFVCDVLLTFTWLGVHTWFGQKIFKASIEAPIRDQNLKPRSDNVVIRDYEQPIDTDFSSFSVYGYKQLVTTQK